MRLLYVVQRYGETIAGGAEQHCREMAERMARRGHHVEVATTCAQSYVDWADAYEPGRSTIGGVVVHRFRVDGAARQPAVQRVEPADGARAGARARSSCSASGCASRARGRPTSSRWLERNARPLRLRHLLHVPLLDHVGRARRRCGAASRSCCTRPCTTSRRCGSRCSTPSSARPTRSRSSTPEEIDLIRAPVPLDPPGAVVGIGVEVGAGRSGALPRRVRARRRAVPALRRPDRRGQGRARARRLLHRVQGSPSRRRPRARRSSATTCSRSRSATTSSSPASSTTRRATTRWPGALALAQPSFFESFSMILTEAFAFGRPALVQGQVRGAARARAAQQRRDPVRRLRRVRVRARDAARRSRARRRDGRGRARRTSSASTPGTPCSTATRRCSNARGRRDTSDR